MSVFPKDTPLMRCRAELARPRRTIGGLVALDPEILIKHYPGLTLDEAKFERERAITERGGKPWELLKVERPS